MFCTRQGLCSTAIGGQGAASQLACTAHGTPRAPPRPAQPSCHQLQAPPLASAGGRRGWAVGGLSDALCAPRPARRPPGWAGAHGGADLRPARSAPEQNRGRPAPPSAPAQMGKLDHPAAGQQPTRPSSRMEATHTALAWPGRLPPCAQQVPRRQGSGLRSSVMAWQQPG